MKRILFFAALLVTSSAFAQVVSLNTSLSTNISTNISTSLNGGLAARAMGGVDVGNAMRVGIPSTGAQLSVPNSWHVQPAGSGGVALSGIDNSRINASKAMLGNLVSPTPLAAKMYLKEIHPSRAYSQIVVNGLNGVRADLVKTATTQSSDIYMFSENNDVIHIQSELHGRGVVTGNDIVSSLRVLYQGQPVLKQKPRTIVLGYRTGSTYQESAAGMYSFARDCFASADHCQDRESSFVGLQGQQLDTGLAGYATGRLVDLGTAPFDKVLVQGQFLVTAKAQTPISDIYTIFKPLDPRDEKPQMTLIVGHTYLVRTVNWPTEDLITKVQVVAYAPTKGFTLRYEKLVSVSPQQLEAQVAAANAYTLQNEQPIAQGEVTLFNRSRWHNYFYASFNFEYSTTGNMFISGNAWDFEVEGEGAPLLEATRSGSEVAMIEDRGTGVDLGSLTTAQFSDLNSVQLNQRSATAVVGHTYLISHASYDNKLVLGAVTVMEIAPDTSWMRLKFRRVSVGPLPHFQKWLAQSDLPARSVVLENAGDQRAVYYPYLGKRGDETQRNEAEISLYSARYLSLEDRPFAEGQNGFTVLTGASLENVTSAQVDALAGSMMRDYQPVVGDVVAVRLENFYTKTLAALRVDAIDSGSAIAGQPAPIRRVKFSIVTLSRAKTAYSDDK